MSHKLLLILFIALSLTGCWDQEEVANRVLVLAIGLDETKEGKTKVSIQIPIVEELLPANGGQALPAKPFSLITAEGKSAFAAVPGLQSKTQRSIFYGQIKAVVIGKTLAERGLTRTNDFLKRHPEVPPQAYMLLTEDKASQILSYPLSNRRLPAYAPVTFFHAHRKGDEAYPQRIWEFDRNIHSKTQDAFLPIISYNHEEQTFIIRGLGIFHADKLVGKLSGEETRMFGLLSGQVNNGYINLSVGKYGLITFRQVRSKSHIKLNRNANGISCELKIKANGYLVESTQGAVQLNESDLKVIEKKTTAYLKREMTKTINRLQQMNSDIFGWGEVFRAHHADAWETTDWDQAYPKVKVNLSVKFSIPRSGTLR